MTIVVESGAKIARWTVVRGAAPGRRRGGLRRRVLCRCVCGAEAPVFVEDLRAQRSTGCRRRECLYRWRFLDDFRRAFYAMLDEYVRARDDADCGASLVVPADLGEDSKPTLDERR